MKRQPTTTILFILIGLFAIACAPARQNGTMEAAMTVEPAATLVVARPSITPTTLPTVTPWLTPTLPTPTPEATATPGSDNEEVETATTPQPTLNKIIWPAATSYNAPIVIEFNYSLDPTTVNLRFEPTITGEVGWNETTTQLIFAPHAPLTSSTRYSLIFADGLTDKAGKTLSIPKPASHTTASAISEVLPQQSSTVHPANTIQITFNRPMDEETTKAAFQMEPRMPGLLEWHENTLEFHPLNDRLAAEATFTISITTAALDVNGHPVFRDDYTWSFQTGAMTERATFGEGVHIQALSLNGRRSVQFAYPAEAIPTAFTLRRLDSQSWLSTASSDGGEVIATWHEEPASYLQEYMRTQETLLPADLPAGIYALDLAVAGQVEDQLVLVLTNHVLTIHEDGTKTAVWVTTLDGQTVANAEVRVLAQDGTLLQNGLTDESGLFVIASAVPENGKIVAQIGDDLTYSGLSGWGNLYTSSPARYALHLYTNRPIYHPGQSLYYRAIMRQNDNGKPVLPPANTPVHVAMRNMEGTIVQTADLNSSHFGTAFGQFALADDLAPGRYFLDIEVDGEIISQRFEVAPARTEATVTVTADKKMYVLDETMHITVVAQTRDGQPLANAAVTVKLFETGSATGCFDTATFNDEWYDSYRDEIQGRTDENGRATFNLKAEMGYNSHQGTPGGNNYHTVWALNAVVNMGEENSSGGFTVVEVSNTAETVTMDLGSRLQQAGQPFTVEGQVLALDGSPVNGRSLFLGLFDPQVGDINARTAEQGQQVVTGSDGRFRTAFTIAQPGLYRLYLIGQDAANHEYFAHSDVYADHPNQTGNFGDTYGDEILVTADRDSYLAGDTAYLLIRTNQDGAALLSFIRGGLYRQQVVQLTTPLTTVAVPITAEDAPNLAVTVQAWGDYYHSFDPQNYYTGSSVPDNRLYNAIIDLNVVDPTMLANVTITPNQAQYTPGQAAAFTLRVTNYQGEPISAELTLSLVGEALYNHYSAHTPSLQDALYHPRISQVQSYDSMSPTRYFPYGEFGGCGCGGWWGEQGNLVSDFSDTAVWFPSLVTDYKGEATVTLTLPHHPGEWRLTARAVTADTQVSETMMTITAE